MLAAPVACQGHTKPTRPRQRQVVAPREPNTPASGLDTLINTLQGVLPGMEGVFLFSVVSSHLGSGDFSVGC